MVEDNSIRSHALNGNKDQNVERAKINGANDDGNGDLHEEEEEENPPVRVHRTGLWYHAQMPSTQEIEDLIVNYISVQNLE